MEHLLCSVGPPKIIFNEFDPKVYHFFFMPILYKMLEPANDISLCLSQFHCASLQITMHASVYNAIKNDQFVY